MASFQNIKTDHLYVLTQSYTCRFLGQIHRFHLITKYSIKFDDLHFHLNTITKQATSLLNIGTRTVSVSLAVSLSTLVSFQWLFAA